MKSFREATTVPFDSSVKSTRWNAIELRQMGIEHHFCAPDQVDAAFNTLERNETGRAAHNRVVMIKGRKRKIETTRGAAVGRALRRSTRVARKTARMHGTPIYIW